MAIRNQIQFRRGSSSEWIAISGGEGPALYSGEPGFDLTNNILKIGDGSTAWKDLQPIGADQSLYKVKNTSGGIIYKGQVVRANGTVGNSDAIQVTTFLADGSVPEYTVMGLATQDMNNNDFGYVTGFGQIRGVDTDPDLSATNICAAGENWLEGDILYASPSASGKLTKVKPQHETIVAIVLNPADNGSLFVRPTWYPHLDDLHNVDSSGATNNQYLIYNSATELWSPTSSGIFTSLDVRGPAVFNEDGGNNDFRIEGDNNTNLFFVDASTDKIGIGTNTPSTTIDASGIIRSFGTNFGIAIDGPNGSGPRISIGSSADYSAYMSIGAYANINNINTVGRDFRLHSTSIDPILYAEYDTGNIGIGTSSPSYKLDVNGLSRFGELTELVYIGNDNIGGEIGTSTSTNYLAVQTVVDSKFRYGGDGVSNHGIVIDSSYNVGIGTESPSYKLQVNGSFGATTKSFRIDHPSRPNYTLEYGSLESPYHGVRLTGRGKVVKGVCVVDLPSYLKDLIHDDENINIQLTNLKHGKTLYVGDIDLNNSQFTVKADRAKTVGDLEFFWTFTGVRKDVPSLVVEQEK